MAGRLAREEGLLVGVSSGANVLAAVGSRPSLAPGKTRRDGAAATPASAT